MVKNTSKQNINLNVRLQIFNENETLITTLNTFHVNKNQILEPQTTKEFICTIDKIPFASGVYSLGLMLNDLNTKKRIYENDRWDKLEVSNGDFYESGRLPNLKNSGIFSIEYKWKIH